MTGSQTELIVRYVDALIQDPAASPPSGLDATDAAFVQAIVQARPVPPLDDALRARIWQRALSAAIVERLAQSKTALDVVHVSSNSNGSYQEDARSMSTISQDLPSDRTMPAGPRRNFWTLAATAAACMVVVIGLLAVGNLRQPEDPATGSGMVQLSDPTATPSPTFVMATMTSSPAYTGDVVTATPSPTIMPLTETSPLVPSLGVPTVMPPTILPPSNITVVPPTVVAPPIGPMAYRATMLDGYLLAPGTQMDGFAWNADSTRQLVWGSNGSIGISDAATGQVIVGQLSGVDPFDGGAWNPDGTRVMVWRSGGTISVWDLMTNTIAEFEHGQTRLFGARWSPDGTQIVTWGADVSTRIWDALAGTTLFTLPHTHNINGAAWNADGSRLLTWSENGYLYEWDTRNGDKMAEAYQAIDDPYSTGTNEYIPVTGAAWSADGSTILSWSSDGYVWLWDYASWETYPVFRYFLPFGAPLTGAALNPVDNRIICWSDYAIYVYSPTTSNSAQMLLHEGAVGGAAWSADGSRILSWSDDATARVWDSATVTQIAYLHHGQQIVQGAQWGANETRIFTWNSSGTVWVWELIPEPGLSPDALVPTASPTAIRADHSSVDIQATADQLRVEATATQIIVDAMATGNALLMGTTAPTVAPLIVTPTVTPTATHTHTATPIPN